MDTLKIGLLGLGTVGTGTYEIIKKNCDLICQRVGKKLEITFVADKYIGQKKEILDPGVRTTDDAFEVVRDPDIDIVVELIGGYEPARSLVIEAVANGKNVVTANKALIAVHGNELFSKAQENSVRIAFEASVAGGIPIIKALREGLAANRIEWIAGIINGTGNYILTEMWDKQRDFGDVLAEAQRLGYAEADPAFDIEGTDAAHKLMILGSIAYGIDFQFEKVYTEGIVAITTQDIKFAEELGYRIKHLGIARRTDQGIEMRVHPTLLPERQMLASVNGVMNAVMVEGDAVGSTLYYGAGAGSQPTGSAVVADLMDLARSSHIGQESGTVVQADRPEILSMDQVETGYYLRMQALDRPGVLADVTRILGEAGISIEAIIQKEPHGDTEVATVIMLINRIKEGLMNQAIEAIEALNSIQGSVTRIRVESLDYVD